MSSSGRRKGGLGPGIQLSTVAAEEDDYAGPALLPGATTRTPSQQSSPAATPAPVTDDEDDGTDSNGADASDVATPTGPIPDKLYFRIGEVAQLVGVDAHVLRYWESEFRLKPHRSASGQRLYRKQDLSRFLRIKHLLHEEGYTIAGARKVLSGQTGGPPTAVDPERIRTALNRVEGLRDRIREFRDDILAAESP